MSKLLYSGAEINAKLDKINKPLTAASVMFFVGGTPYVVPSGLTWQEIFDINLYSWLDEEGGVNVDGNVITENWDEYPIDHYEYVKTITFDVDGEYYSAPDGVTWREWIDSGEADERFSINEDDTIEAGGGWLRLYVDDLADRDYEVLASDKIVDGATYNMEA